MLDHGVMSSTAKRLVLSWRGRKQSQDSSVGRLVGQIGSSTPNSGDNHELDEIAIVSSNADPCHVKYGSGNTLCTINGPRLVPGNNFFSPEIISKSTMPLRNHYERRVYGRRKTQQ